MSTAFFTRSSSFEVDLLEPAFADTSVLSVVLTSTSLSVSFSMTVSFLLSTSTITR